MRTDWREIPCALACPDPIEVPPSCDRAWHHACADKVFLADRAQREADRKDRREGRWRP